MMRKHVRLLLLTLFMFLVTLWLVGVAQSADSPLAVGWFALPGGGGQSVSTDFNLNGSAGLPAADTSSGGNFLLSLDFWSAPSGSEAGTQLFLPLLAR